MLKPVQQKLYKSIEEVFDGEVNIQSNSELNFLYKDNPSYQKAKKDKRVKAFEHAFYDNWTEAYIKENLAVLQPCRLYKNRIEHDGDGKSWFGFYLVNDVVYNQRSDLVLRHFHPLSGKFQSLMDASFEAGLPMAWENFYYEDLNNEYSEKKNQLNDSDKKILDFDAIGPLFLLLVFGYSIALVVFVCEIFYHDLIIELVKFYKEKWKK